VLAEGVGVTEDFGVTLGRGLSLAGLEGAPRVTCMSPRVAGAAALAWRTPAAATRTAVSVVAAMTTASRLRKRGLRSSDGELLMTLRPLHHLEDLVPQSCGQ
jgi:hypothetical protein